MALRSYPLQPGTLPGGAQLFGLLETARDEASSVTEPLITLMPPPPEDGPPLTRLDATWDDDCSVVVPLFSIPPPFA